MIQIRHIGFLLFLLAVTVHAKTVSDFPVIPSDALTWRQLIHQRNLPPYDVTSAEAVAFSWRQAGVMVFPRPGQVPIDLPLPAAGRYQLHIGHLSGANYGDLDVFLNGELLGKIKRKTEQVQTVSSLFETPLVPAQGNRLLLKPSVGSSLGLVFIYWTPIHFEAVPANFWKTTCLPNVEYNATQTLAFDKPDQLGDLNSGTSWRDINVGEPSVDLTGVGGQGVVCATTYLFHPSTHSGYYFRLQSKGPATLSINGKNVVSVASGEISKPVLVTSRQMRHAVTRLLIKMPAGSSALATLQISPLAGGKLFSKVPVPYDPSLHVKDWPRVTIKTGQIKALVALPDVTKGYYRGPRFEQAGMIPSLVVKGHSYFGEFRSPRQPVAMDHGAGPAEAFYEPLGYEQAKVGEGFIKLGVGVFEKPLERSYFFGSPYWPLKRFDWKTTVNGNNVVFIQAIQGPRGWGYHYTKRLVFSDRNPVLSIEHTLRNTGKHRIVTNQYNHNFILIDGEPAGSDYEIIFGGQVRPLRMIPSRVQWKRGRLRLKGGSFFSPMQGLVRQAENRITVRRISTGVGVTLTGDFSPYRLWFFTSARAVCPEPFVHVNLAPGEAMSWIRQYEFSMGK